MWLPLKQYPMVLNLRFLLKNYRIPILGLVVCVALIIWFGCVETGWVVERNFETTRALPYAAVVVMMVLQYALGRRFIFGRKSRRSLDSSDRQKLLPWLLGACFLCLIPWSGLLALIAANGFPEHWIGQSVRALFGLLACCLTAFFWGNAAFRFGDRWAWAVPISMYIGWALGSTFDPNFHFNKRIYSCLEDVAETAVHELKWIAFFPLVLIGLIAGIGVWVSSRKSPSPYLCLLLAPLMVGPRALQGYLKHRNEELFYEWADHQSPPHAVAPELNGSKRLEPVKLVLPLDEIPRWGKSWTFEIPWNEGPAEGKFPFLSGTARRELRVSHDGQPISKDLWGFSFVRDTAHDRNPNKPLLLQVNYAPFEKAPKQPPPNIQVRANLSLTAFRFLRSIPVNGSSEFVENEILVRISPPTWSDTPATANEPASRLVTREWHSRIWRPIPAITGEMDPLVGDGLYVDHRFVMAWNHGQQNLGRRYASHLGIYFCGMMSRNFFESTTDSQDHEWRFPAPQDEAEWAKFIGESTLNIYAADQEWETPITLDLALP